MQHPGHLIDCKLALKWIREHIAEYGGDPSLVYIEWCAPGSWDLYRCEVCGSGYLDPRPNAATIGLAYSSYSTHGAPGGVDQPERSAWRRFRNAQRNAYLNREYGYQL